MKSKAEEENMNATTQGFCLDDGAFPRKVKPQGPSNEADQGGAECCMSKLQGINMKDIEKSLLSTTWNWATF